jgi:hypothetical protein
MGSPSAWSSASSELFAYTPHGEPQAPHNGHETDYPTRLPDSGGKSRRESSLGPRIDLTFAHSWVTRFARLVYRGREDRTSEKTAAKCEQEQHVSRGVAPQRQTVTRRSQETLTAEKIAQGIDITAFA